MIEQTLFRKDSDMIKENTKNDNIVGSAVFLAITAIFVKFIGLLYKIPMAHALSDEGMGYFNAAYTIYSLLYLLGTAGVPKAITVLISGCEKREEEKRKIFFAAIRLFFWIGLSLFILLLVFAETIANAIGSPGTAPAILLISPCLLMVSLGGVYRGYLNAIGDFSAIAIASIIEAGGKLAFGLLLIFVGRALLLPLPWICAMSVLGIGIGVFASAVYLRFNIKIKKKEEKEKQINISRNENSDLCFKIMRIALPITLGSVAAGISSVIDLSMIMKRLEFGGLSAEEATAVYGNYTTLVVPMLQLASAVLSPIAIVLLPRFAASKAGNKAEDFQSYFYFGCQMCAFISVPLAFIFFFFPQELLSMLFPASSAAIAAPLLRLIAPGVVIFSILLILNTVLEASKHAGLQMFSMLISIFVKIPIGYFLLGLSRYAIAGAPIGTVCGYAASLIFSLLCCYKIKGIYITILKSYLLPFFNSTISVLFMFFVSHYVVNAFDSFLGKIFIFLLFAVVYILLSYFTGVLHVCKIDKMAHRTKKVA